MSTATLTKLLVAAALTLSIASHARAQEKQLDDSPAAEAPHKTVSTNDLVDQMGKIAGDDDVVARKPEPKKMASGTPKKKDKKLDFSVAHGAPKATKEEAAPVASSSPSNASSKSDALELSADENTSSHRPNPSNIPEVLDDKAQNLQVDSELNEADADSYRSAAQENDAEASKLRGEIKGLERDLKSSLSSSMRAKKVAALTEKRLDLLKNQQHQATLRSSHAAIVEKQAQQRVFNLKAKVSANESRLSSTRQKTSDMEGSISQLNRDRSDLERKLKTTIAQIEFEKAKQKALAAKKAKLAAKNKEINKQIAKKLNSKAKPKTKVASSK